MMSTNARQTLNVFALDEGAYIQVATGVNIINLNFHSAVAARKLSGRRIPPGAITITCNPEDRLNREGLAAVLKWISARVRSDGEEMTVASIQTANPTLTIADNLTNKITFLNSAHILTMHSRTCDTALRNSIMGYATNNVLEPGEYQRILVVLHYDRGVVSHVLATCQTKLSGQLELLREFVQWCDGHGLGERVGRAKTELRLADRHAHQ